MDRKEELMKRMVDIAYRGRDAALAGDMNLSNELFLQIKPLMLEYGQLTGDPDYQKLIEQGVEAHKNSVN